MKKQVLSAISKFTLGVVLISGVLVAQAQTTPVNFKEKTAAVKYLGNAEGAVLFNVSFENPESRKFLVTITDEDGIQLFQQAFTDKKFNKRFKLPRLDQSKLTFVIRNLKDIELKETFEINTRVVEDVVVTKL